MRLRALPTEERPNPNLKNDPPSEKKPEDSHPEAFLNLPKNQEKYDVFMNEYEQIVIQTNNSSACPSQTVSLPPVSTFAPSPLPEEEPFPIEEQPSADYENIEARVF